MNIKQLKIKNLSWKKISEISTSGNAHKILTIGDTKQIKLYTGEIIELVIIGFNHDDKANGSGKAGITFAFKNFSDGCFEMNSICTNKGGWEKSKMRNVYMQRFFKLLPCALIKNIKPVIKLTAGGNENVELVSTIDKLFLFSFKEVTGTSDYYLHGEGEQYEYFKEFKNRIKEDSWWLRSPNVTNATYFRIISTSGSVVIYNSYGTYRLCLGFCI